MEKLNSCNFSALSRNFFSQPLRIFSQLLRIFSQLVRLRMYREFLRMYFLISPVVSVFSPDVLGVVGFSHIIEPIITGVGLWLYCLWKCIFPVLGQSKMDRPLKYFTTSKRDASDQLSGPMGIARNIEMASCPPPCSSSGGHPVAPARSFGKYRIIRSPKAIGYDLMFLEKQKQGFLCGKEASSALQSTELLTGCS